MVIGLLGTEINNNNMGCVALTYSILLILERIAKENGFENEYILFEVTPNKDKTDLMCENLCIPQEKITNVKVGRFGSYKSIIGHWHENIQFVKYVRKCDLVVDLTQGDSFTDIYGEWIFYSYTRMKRIVIAQGVPLVLGSQTYGPFKKSRCKKYALDTINKAYAVVTRDDLSKKFLNNNGVKNVAVTTDLAFFLPYKQNNESHDRIKVGINVSGLLVSNKIENTQTDFTLKTDYDKYMLSIIDILSSNPIYEVHLIPHVEEDYYAGIKLIGDQYKNITIVKPFTSPIEAKSYISSMDLFLGSRMHATIAAFSSGVATVPIAYSRKFKGLFATLGYRHIIDLQEETTSEAVRRTQNMIDNYNDIQSDLQKCDKRIKQLKDQTYSVLSSLIIKIKG